MFYQNILRAEGRYTKVSGVCVCVFGDSVKTGVHKIVHWLAFFVNGSHYKDLLNWRKFTMGFVKYTLGVTDFSALVFVGIS